MRVAAALACALLALLHPGTRGHTAPEGALDSATVHVRSVKSPDHLLSLIAGAAHERGITRVHVAFDGISFAPPPGRNEYRHYARLDGDIERWLDALQRWGPPAGLEVEAFSTIRKERVALRRGSGLWRDRLHDELTYAWWADDTFKRFESARTWMQRYLKQTHKGGKRLLVLLAGDLTPERWVAPGSVATRGTNAGLGWRLKLPEVGRYWDEEALGALLKTAGVPLMVVAPEARFEDHHPVPELPSMPWVARPEFPGGGSIQLRALGLGSPTTGGSGGISLDLGQRFETTTPTWFWRPGHELLFQNDTPSAYGYWPYARVAALTGGRYYFYPFSPSTWLDVCPRDVHQLNALAPELVSRRELVRRRVGDKLLAAICAASALVQDDTPWIDDATLTDSVIGGSQGDGFRLPTGRGLGGGWSGQKGAGRANPNYRARRKPWDIIIAARPTKEPRPIQKAGRQLIALVAKYDKASKRLGRALAQAKPEETHPRTLANARHTQFQLAMSAFHLHALGLYLSEVERWRPARANPRHCVITYVPAIRMSDCLEAYDGRSIDAVKEAEFLEHPRLKRPPLEGQQGNILPFSINDPDFRAKRSLSAVLKNLDKRLRRRALTMIRAAERVMKHHARTPWGWSVYYGNAFTFIWKPVYASGYTPASRPGPAPDSEPDPGPSTPRGGGSTGGSPSTGGGK